MEAKSPKRDNGAFKIPEGTYVEQYTPAIGRIVSPSLGKQLQYAKMILSADAVVTFKDGMGNQVNAFPLSKGPQPFIVTEISVATGASVLIVHEGIPVSTASDMTGPVYS